jgi:hypothetical protein
MLSSLLLLTVLAPAPVLAVALLTVRARGVVRRDGPGALASRSRAAWREGTRRPVWLGVGAVGAGTGLLTAVLERSYLATVEDGSRWGVDVVLLTVVLGLLAVVGAAAVAGVVASAVARGRGLGAGTVAGLLVVVAVAAGSATAHLPLRASYLAEPGRFPVVGNVAEGDLLVPFDTFLVALLWALPWSVLGAALGAHNRDVDGDHGVRDVWKLLLGLATADLPENRAAWGGALRAELAAIDQPAERRRFALGGVVAVLRAARPLGAWVPVAGVAVVVAFGTFAASRWSLAHDRGGVLGFWLAVPSALLFAVTLDWARRSRSFGSGLRTGARAGLAALVAVLVVALPEALVWADRQAGYLSTGDAVPPDWQSAVGDVLRPEFLLGMIALWTMGTASGAALGTALGRLSAGAARTREASLTVPGHAGRPAP